MRPRRSFSSSRRRPSIVTPIGFRVRIVSLSPPQDISDVSHSFIESESRAPDPREKSENPSTKVENRGSQLDCQARVEDRGAHWERRGSSVLLRAPKENRVLRQATLGCVEISLPTGLIPDPSLDRPRRRRTPRRDFSPRSRHRLNTIAAREQGPV